MKMLRIACLVLTAPVWLPGLIVGILISVFMQGLRAGYDLFD